MDFLTYKEKPLVRKGNEIYYGDMAEPFIIKFTILSAKKEDIIAVGDNINDTHMIAEFRSYAMANAVDSIKELADFITPGVAELIEKELG